ncbi:MAG: hypothetical protein L6Q60_13995 [Rhodocyclaceae bacterium]|nr:hypothetical protein [Rhodocyclaceae bacterium]
MNLLGKVRRLHYRDGHTLSEIERRTGLTRKTIRKWLNPENHPQMAHFIRYAAKPHSP